MERICPYGRRMLQRERITAALGNSRCVELAAYGWEFCWPKWCRTNNDYRRSRCATFRPVSHSQAAVTHVLTPQGQPLALPGRSVRLAYGHNLSLAVALTSVQLGLRSGEVLEWGQRRLRSFMLHHFSRLDASPTSSCLTHAYIRRAAVGPAPCS